MDNQHKLDEIHQYIRDIRDNIIQINNTIQDNPKLESIINRIERESLISKEGVSKLIVLQAYLHFKKNFEGLPQELDYRIAKLEELMKDDD